jgi:hypothetical protein
MALLAVAPLDVGKVRTHHLEDTGFPLHRIVVSPVRWKKKIVIFLTL